MNVAALAITVAVTSNTKGAIAWIGGGRSFGVDVAKVFGAAIVGGVVVALGNVRAW